MHNLSPHARACHQKPIASRSFRVLLAPTNTEKGLVRVTIDGFAADYCFDILRVDAECGVASVELKKLEPEQAVPYHVLIANDGSARCDCMGYLRHDRCKHADLAPRLVCRVAEMPELAVRQESGSRLVIESADGGEVAAIVCESGITEDHRRSANYIAGNPDELRHAERLQANVEQLPGTAFQLASNKRACRRKSRAFSRRTHAA